MCSKDLIFQVGVTPLEENNTTNQRDNGAKSDLDDFFSVKVDITRSSPVKQANTQEVAKDSVTDLFDPLLTDSNFRMLLEIMSRNPIWLQLLKQKNYYLNSKTNVLKDPQLVSYGNSLISPYDGNLRPTN